jgi:hypothetical protein
MSSVETNIQNALLKRVQSLTTTLPIAWPNLDFTPPADGSPYLAVRILPNRNERVFLGSNDPTYRQGILQINVVTQYNKGPSASVETAGQIALHFPQDLVLRESGVNVQLTKAPDVGSAVANPNGTNWLVPISIYYEAFA